MKTRIDRTLEELLEGNGKWRRLRRNRDRAAFTLVLAEVLCELEAKGDAMRYLDGNGRVAWRATPKLKDYVNDLKRDAEADLESESR